jgi:sugar-specific transcriptional regulator TrmB
METPTRSLLVKLGYTANATQVYEFLAHAGLSSAKTITSKTQISRVLVYRSLEELQNGNLVVENNERPVARFEVAHPDTLIEIATRRKQDAQILAEEAQSTREVLLSLYNLTHNKPGVRFFEGIEGLRIILDDSLTSETEILSWADPTQILTGFAEINKSYIAKRSRFNIKKRIISPDNPHVRSLITNYYTDVTEVRLATLPISHLDSTIQIYDNKVSYINHTKDSIISLIIEDAAIASLHRATFELAWTHAQPHHLEVAPTPRTTTLALPDQSPGSNA